MRVGIDAHMVGARETGNETYIRGLVQGLAEVEPPIDVVVYHCAAPWVTPSSRLSFRRLAASSPLLRLTVELPLRAALDRIQVVLTSYSTPLWGAATDVVMIHDVAFRIGPQWFSPRDLRVLNTAVPRSIRRARIVLTGSQAAKKDLLTYFPEAAGKIRVSPYGPGPAAVTPPAREADQALVKFGLDRSFPYMLAVGNIQPRKNLVRLVEAFGRLVSRLPSLAVRLVLAGPARWQAGAVMDAAAEHGDLVVLTGYISDVELASLYQSAAAFVLPSLYEGFGLPALEAMAHGVPLAVSSAGALAEVCGDAALTFDPTDLETMECALERILVDTAFRRQSSAAGRVRAQAFTWSRAASLAVAAFVEAGSR